jgi:hypothetical protein
MISIYRHISISISIYIHLSWLTWPGFLLSYLSHSLSLSRSRSLSLLHNYIIHKYTHTHQASSSDRTVSSECCGLFFVSRLLNSVNWSYPIVDWFLCGIQRRTQFHLRRCEGNEGLQITRLDQTCSNHVQLTNTFQPADIPFMSHLHPFYILLLLSCDHCAQSLGIHRGQTALGSRSGHDFASDRLQSCCRWGWIQKF